MDVGNLLVWVVWLAAAFACLGSGVAVVTFSNPFYSALALIGNLGSLAVLYLLLSAEFVAAAQVLVYAGAVMVMFLFVIAYLGGRADAPWAGGPTWQQAAAASAAGALLVEVVIAVGLKAGGRLSDEADVDAFFGGPHQIGTLFLTDHLLAFEITSIVLLIAAVGGVILGAHSRRPGDPVPGGTSRFPQTPSTGPLPRTGRSAAGAHSRRPGDPVPGGTSRFPETASTGTRLDVGVER